VVSNKERSGVLGKLKLKYTLSATVLHTSSKTSEIYTHVAAHKIVTIRSPIAGLIKQSS